EVIVAGAYNPHKESALFPADEGVEMIREVIHDPEPRARGRKFSGLSGDYAAGVGTKAVIGTLPSVTDFDYELRMVNMNKQRRPNIETVFLCANPKGFFVASRLIREIAGYGQRVPDLVPEVVMNRLRKKLGVA